MKHLYLYRFIIFLGILSSFSLNAQKIKTLSPLKNAIQTEASSGYTMEYGYASIIDAIANIEHIEAFTENAFLPEYVNLDKITTYSSSDEVLRTFEHKKSVIDGKTLYTSESRKWELNVLKSIEKVEFYYYDNIIETLTYEWPDENNSYKSSSSQELILTGKIKAEYIYNEAKQPTRINMYAFLEDGYELISYVVTTYEGKTKSISKMYMASSPETPMSIITSTFNDAGLPIKVIAESMPGSPVASKVTTTYSYNSDNAIIKEETINEGSLALQTAASKVEYAYDGKLLKSYTEYTKAPQAEYVIDKVCNLSYNSSNRISNIQFTDKDKNEVRTLDLQYDNNSLQKVIEHNENEEARTHVFTAAQPTSSDDINKENEDILIISQSGAVNIKALSDTPCAVYNLSGQLLHKLTLKAGTETTLSLPMGIYFINRKKVVVY